MRVSAAAYQEEGEFRDHTIVCLRDLRLLAEAKQGWADQKNQPNGAGLTWDDLAPDFLAEKLDCLMRGTYLIEPLGSRPRCTIQPDVNDSSFGDGRCGRRVRLTGSWPPSMERRRQPRG